MAMPITAKAEDYVPRPEINTTPLIDVMLVLLIMFIMIIPEAKHQIPVDLPSPNGETEEHPVHRLVLDEAGRTWWDGAAVDGAELRRRLAAFAADPMMPSLHVDTHADTRYERFGEVLDDIRSANITRLGFVGNERHIAAISGR